MAASSSHLFFLSQIACLMLLGFARAGLAPHHKHEGISNVLIGDTCQKTPFKDLCVDTLAATTKAASADLTELACISIQAAVHQAAKSGGHVANLLNTYHPPTLQQCLSDCAEIYEDVVQQLNDAIGALEKPDLVDDAVKWLTAAMSEIDTCESGCNMQSFVKNILTQWNSEVKNITSVALAIVNLLPMKKETVPPPA